MIEGRIAHLEDRGHQTDQRLNKHDERLKRHDTLILENAELICQGSKRHDQVINTLKLTHGMEMAGLLNNNNKDDRAERIKNEYIQNFATLFRTKKNKRQGPSTD